jgi:peroxiredoxin
MKAYQADSAKFDSTDTQIFGLSMDSLPSNREFAQKIGVTFPILSDWTRQVVKEYGIYDSAKSDYAGRATFVIDKDGIIQHIKEGNDAVDPTSAEDTCNILSHKKTQ